jgi:exosortase A
MNAPSLAGAPVVLPAWHRVVLPLGLGLLLLAGIFYREIAAAIQTWTDSTAYNHCFLVLPIVGYLLWDRRFDLHGVPIRPWLPAVFLGVPIGLVWLLAERLGIMEGRQLAVISFVEVLFLAVLGPRLWWAMAGPLLYLYFLVPFGEFLTPQLQDITTFFIRHGLEILGIPAYIDGYIIEIPQGTFFVAEACAGLRFLIASIAFGCLYALIMYRSPFRRGVFMLVSIVVPIIANGLRGIGIVYLGYRLNSAQAAAVDHVIYGWLFFSVVILLLIVLGLPFRQDEMTTRSAQLSFLRAPAAARRRRGALTAALALVVVAAASPAVSAGLALATLKAVPVPDAIDVGPDCSVTAIPSASAVHSQRVTCGETEMDMSWQAFSPRSTAAAVMAARRYLTRGVDSKGRSEAWLETADATPTAWRIMQSNDPVYALGVAVWIDGEAVRPGLRMRVRMALESLLGSAHTPMVVIVTPAVVWDGLTMAQRRAAEESLGDFLLRHRDLDHRIGALTAMQ